ncbi:DUF982 domain-containing protein [Aminobacter sp. UC22_36]|uniref:DUF982 domain-containing protein n=1 Tax=Aminobacter sp. UC22_36 TaxID=3374549 RepID=UPI00375764D6
MWTGVRPCNPPPSSALVWMEIVPTILINGPGFSLREIRSVPEAVEFLDEWPANARGPFFYLAESAIQGAIHGSISIEEAREAFTAFCGEFRHPVD